MRFLSVCSGIEAASVAWHPLGWRAWGLAEIEAFPSAVLAHHYPSVPNLGDMTKFKDWPDGSIDLLCGGTPCQSFSNAGLRAGLDDPRGQLMLTFGAIAARYRPKWLVWENVPGVLSSNGGRDFGAFLGLLGFLGYGFAYRVLDAQFVRVDGYGRAVPQRRQRVFVVGCLGDWRSAAAVLLEREGLQGHPAPRRSAGSGLAAGALAGVGPGSGWRIGADEAAAGQLIAFDGQNIGIHEDVSGTLDTGAAHQNRGMHVAHALRAKHNLAHRDDVDTYVAHTLRGEGFDASEDGTGRGTPLVPAFLHLNKGRPDGRQSAHTEMVTVEHGAVPTLTTDGHQQSAVAYPLPFDTTQITSASNYSNPKAGDPCHPLAAGAHAPAVAFGWMNAAAQGMPVDTISPTLDKSKHPAAMTFQERGREGGRSLEIGGDVAYAMTAPSGGGRAQERNVMTGAAVRRLMPVECERLQGFPDNYTLIPLRNASGKLNGKWSKDGPRYKALGNSWAVNCARWIGRRISLVEQINEGRAA